MTIPKIMRERLGIRSGEEVEFEEHEDFLVVRKRVAVDSLEELRGLVRWQGSVDDYLIETRGAAWHPDLDGNG